MWGRGRTAAEAVACTEELVLLEDDVAGAKGVELRGNEVHERRTAAGRTGGRRNSALRQPPTMDRRLHAEHEYVSHTAGQSGAVGRVGSGSVAGSLMEQVIAVSDSFHTTDLTIQHARQTLVSQTGPGASAPPPQLKPTFLDVEPTILGWYDSACVYIPDLPKVGQSIGGHGPDVSGAISGTHGLSQMLMWNKENS